MKSNAILFLLLLVGHSLTGQTKKPLNDREITNQKAEAAIPFEKTTYGNNPEAGRYADVGDAMLYYEIYGKGKPIVLLHGGVYGYIDEFEPFIARLSKSYTVICVATRGHGKSEIGTSPFTWQQRAEDAYTVIRSVTKEKVIVVGFSDGAYTGYKLAALHPEVVKKLIAIGAGDQPEGSRKGQSNYTSEKLLLEAKNLFESRLRIMPEPRRWNECLSMLNTLYNDDFISRKTFEKIKCPTLVMSGDQDEYHRVEDVKKASEMIPGSRIKIIKGCGHVVFFCNFAAVWGEITLFLNR